MQDPNPSKSTKITAVSLFPTFSDLPDPPVEEMVEPKSFRNTMIRTLLWMTIVPVFALFFLLHTQIHSATEADDHEQLSIARNIAQTTSNYIADTVKMVRFSSNLMELKQEPKIVLQSMLESLSKQHSGFVYGAWLDSDRKILASYVSPDSIHANHPFDPRILMDLDDERFYISHISDDRHCVQIALKTLVDGEQLYFEGVLRMEPLIALMRDITREQRFSITLFEGKSRLIFNSSDVDFAELLALTDADWASIHESPNGVIIRHPAPRNVAQVRSFVYIPELRWTIVASESVYQRDALIRSSSQTAVIVLIVTLAVSVLAGVLTAGPLSRSVNALADAVRRFGRSGDFDETLVKILEKEGTSEMISLGESFERMAKDIQSHNTQLAQLNTELEAQVMERTATVLLRNRELRILHRLLVPIQGADDQSELKLVKESLDEFRTLLDLSDLRFVPFQSLDLTQEDSLQSQPRVSVTMNNRQFGWLELGESDLLTPDREESLIRLANSLSILLANKKLVNQLEKEHATLQTVFESMTDGILIIGRSGRVIYSNDLAAKMLNNSQSIVGKFVNHLVFDHWKPVNASQFITVEQLTEATRFIPIDASTMGTNQTIDIVAFKVADLPGFSGERVGLLIRDITHEAEIERMKDNLMSVVAHELKTPVTAVRLQAESLRHYCLEKKVTDLSDIEELIDESARLGQLIDDLLDISRIEGGAMKLVPKVIQVASLIDRAARLTSSRYAIRVERQIDSDAETFLADPDRITQVFINLFNNAARYKKPTQDAALCRVTVVPQEEFVRIEVKDFGRGIPGDIIDYVFERFYQANMTDQRVSGGTGLGLSIVRGIVEAHGGEISVDSVLEEYTRFVILLPY